jgi:hypothetical protein
MVRCVYFKYSRGISIFIMFFQTKNYSVGVTLCATGTITVHFRVRCITTTLQKTIMDPIFCPFLITVHSNSRKCDGYIATISKVRSRIVTSYWDIECTKPRRKSLNC